LSLFETTDFAISGSVFLQVWVSSGRMRSFMEGVLP
jgi:hypothetical protein